MRRREAADREDEIERDIRALLLGGLLGGSLLSGGSCLGCGRRKEQVSKHSMRERRNHVLLDAAVVFFAAAVFAGAAFLAGAALVAAAFLGAAC